MYNFRWFFGNRNEDIPPSWRRFLRIPVEIATPELFWVRCTRYLDIGPFLVQTQRIFLTLVCSQMSPNAKRCLAELKDTGDLEQHLKLQRKWLVASYSDQKRQISDVQYL